MEAFRLELFYQERSVRLYISAKVSPMTVFVCLLSSSILVELTD